jgi:uncharacterized protein YkwD
MIKLILIAVCIAVAIVADHEHGHDDDADVHDLLEYISGHGIDELDHNAEETGHHDLHEMNAGLGHTSETLGSEAHDMDHAIGEMSVLEEPMETSLDDNAGPHFEALSAGYGRKQQNMYEREKPARGYSKKAAKPDAGEPKPAATSKPSFDDFNNSKPQNDGNCLHAVNKERQAAGVPELISNQTMVDLAAKHSSYMAASQALSHDGFWSYRFDAVPTGIIGVGELVVADDLSSTPNGPAKRAVDKWIGSIEHKALLLRPDMFVMGCSTAQGSDGRFYATAIVGSK